MTDVLLIIIGGLLLAVTCCVIYLFCWVKKLNRLVNALDPMSTYKKVGPSIYLKRPQRDTSSVSSSFKHIHAAIKPYNGEQSASKVKDEPSIGDIGTSLAGTLDRNYFTRMGLEFNNENTYGIVEDPSKSKGVESVENASKKRGLLRKDLDPDAIEAITKLDKVLY